MTVYSKNLYLNFLPIGTFTLITPNPAKVTILRDIELFNGSGTVSTMSLAVSSSGNALVFIWLQDHPAATTYQWKGRLVVPAGSEVTATIGNDYWHLNVSGYELE